MSFMAGFAEGFGKTFTAGIEAQRRKQEKLEQRQFEKDILKETRAYQESLQAKRDERDDKIRAQDRAWANQDYERTREDRLQDYNTTRGDAIADRNQQWGREDRLTKEQREYTENMSDLDFARNATEAERRAQRDRGWQVDDRTSSQEHDTNLVKLKIAAEEAKSGREHRQKEQEWANTARSWSKTYGIPAAVIYERLRAGGNPDTVLDDLKKENFKADAPQVPSDAPLREGGAPQTVDPVGATDLQGGTYIGEKPDPSKGLDINKEMEVYAGLQEAVNNGVPGAQEELEKYRNTRLPAVQSAQRELAAPKDRPQTREAILAEIVRQKQSNDPAVRSNADNEFNMIVMADRLENLAKTQDGSSAQVVVTNPQTGEGKVITATKGVSSLGPTYTDTQTGKTYNPGLGENVRLLTPEESELEVKILEAGKTPEASAHRQSIARVATASHLTRDLISLANTDDRLLATGVTGLAGLANSAVKEITTGLGLLDGQVPIDDAKKMQELENKVNSILPKDITTLADAANLFQAKKIFLAYNLAASQGQDGRNLSNQEFSTIMQAMSANASKSAFSDTLAEIMKDQVKQVDENAKVLQNTNVYADEFERRTGVRSPIMIAPSMDEFIKKSGDDTIKDNLDFIKKFDIENPSPEYIERTTARRGEQGNPALAQPQAAQQGTAPAPQETRSIPPKAIDALKANPQLRDQFDAKFGPGSSAQILGN